ncbi:MAG: hypothetical protein JKX84_02165 [Flavobacteriales bacterium]|nr:hypothetical protein [Flavobacteriales bacterium]
MKNEAVKNAQNPKGVQLATSKTSMYLLTGAVVLFSLSLVLIVNLAFANESNTFGALIKVNSELDGNTFGQMNANVKSVNGNVLAIDIAKRNYIELSTIKGVCAAHLDHVTLDSYSTVNMEATKTKFRGANVVVGILDNSGHLDKNAIAQLQKVEVESNIGFVSYLSNNPNSTVIIRNLKGGESNMVQALSYMEEYAKTVGKPLVIELVLHGKEMSNPLFVQVCQRMADGGVQFLGAGVDMGMISENRGIQLAFTMYNSKTGQVTDHSDYWAINEIMDQELLLLGSDGKTCSFNFNTEAGFEKVFLSNASDDAVMISAISADGFVHYYNVENKQTALIPRSLFNGMPILEDGMEGLLPHLSKPALFNGIGTNNRMIALGNQVQNIELQSSQMGLNLSQKESGFLQMKLDNMSANLIIEIKDKSGEVVYMNSPDYDIESLQAKIDLSDSADGLYFLDLTSPQFHQTFALLMD